MSQKTLCDGCGIEKVGFKSAFNAAMYNEARWGAFKHGGTAPDMDLCTRCTRSVIDHINSLRSAATA